MITYAGVIGVVCGLVASLPMLYVLAASTRRVASFSIGVLIACCAVPFIVLQVLMLAVNFLWHEGAVRFGMYATVSFLAVVVICTIIARPWR